MIRLITIMSKSTSMSGQADYALLNSSISEGSMSKLE